MNFIYTYHKQQCKENTRSDPLSQYWLQESSKYYLVTSVHLL